MEGATRFQRRTALMYQGDNPEDYRGLYEIKAQNEKQAWEDLIALCKKLEETPDDKLETELTKILDIDRALWFLAVDNVFNDDDGYYSRGSDYVIYQDPGVKRFHIMPRDSNETFRMGGGGPGGPVAAAVRGRRSGGSGGVDVLIGDGPELPPRDGAGRGAGEGRAGPGDRGGADRGVADHPVAVEATADLGEQVAVPAAAVARRKIRLRNSMPTTGRW